MRDLSQRIQRLLGKSRRRRDLHYDHHRESPELNAVNFWDYSQQPDQPRISEVTSKGNADDPA